MSTMPTVDVIIPTYKPGNELRELLRRLENQTLKPGHILIINTDEALWQDKLTEDIPSAEVFHITREQFDHAGTRDMGAGLSAADIIVFMTQDAMPRDENLLMNLMESFTESNIAAVYARQLPKKNADVVERFTREFNYPPVSHVYGREAVKEHGIKAYFCSNVCAAYNHTYYERAGGFWAPGIFNEDMIFAARAIRDGQKIAYAAEAQVYHSHHYGMLEQFHRYFDNGVSQADHPEIFRDVPSSGEGKKLVKATIRYLKKKGQRRKIPGLIMVSGFKYLGFFLGKHYKSLPRFLVRAFSLNKAYWDIKVTVE